MLPALEEGRGRLLYRDWPGLVGLERVTSVERLFIAITDLGDSATLSAICLVSVAFLAWSGHRREAGAVLLAWLTAALAIALLKIAVAGCGLHLFRLDIRSPSGHAAMSASVLGSLAAVASRQLTGRRRLLAVLPAALLVGAIAATRVSLGIHSLHEVLAGLVVGGSVALLARRWMRGVAHAPLDLRRLSLSLAVVALAMAGTRLPAERVIRMISASLRAHAPFCAQGAGHDFWQRLATGPVAPLDAGLTTGPAWVRLRRP